MEQRFLTESEVNIMRGKNLGDALTKNDLHDLFNHVDMLESLLDEQIDTEDFFGTEGWRKHVGIDRD